MVREYRRAIGGKVTKSLSIDPVLAEEVAELARSEGHNNFSTIVVRALREFFERIRREKAA